jgi:hypothetical protein
MGIGSGRPGGNPDFGTKYKFDYGNEEKRSEALTIRITPSLLKELKNIAGDEYRDFCRQAIAKEVERHAAAQTTTETKTKTTEQEQPQPQPNNQTNQTNPEADKDPSQQELEASQERRDKEPQNQAQKLMTTTTQSRNPRNNGKKKPTEQDQPDKGN